MGRYFEITVALRSRTEAMDAMTCVHDDCAKQPRVSLNGALFCGGHGQQAMSGFNLAVLDEWD